MLERHRNDTITEFITGLKQIIFRKTKAPQPLIPGYMSSENHIQAYPTSISDHDQCQTTRVSELSSCSLPPETLCPPKSILRPEQLSDKIAKNVTAATAQISFPSICQFRLLIFLYALLSSHLRLVATFPISEGSRSLSTSRHALGR